MTGPTALELSVLRDIAAGKDLQTTKSIGRRMLLGLADKGLVRYSETPVAGGMWAAWELTNAGRAALSREGQKLAGESK